MSTTITNIFATLSAEERARVRQINQEQCGDSMVGGWIALFGYSGLMTALRLDEGAFRYAYPELAAQIGDRGGALDRVFQHYSECKRCQLIESNFGFFGRHIHFAAAASASRHHRVQTRTEEQKVLRATA